MVTALDDAVGEIVEALKESQMYDNTIIVLQSDVSVDHPDEKKTGSLSTFSHICTFAVIEWRDGLVRWKQLSSPRLQGH